MSADQDGGPGEGPAEEAAPDGSRGSELRHRLLAMGGVLSEVTSDDTDHGWGDVTPPDAEDRASEARLRRDVPPHHGG